MKNNYIYIKFLSKYIFGWKTIFNPKLGRKLVRQCGPKTNGF